MRRRRGAAQGPMSRTSSLSPEDEVYGEEEEELGEMGAEEDTEPPAGTISTISGPLDGRIGEGRSTAMAAPSSSASVSSLAGRSDKGGTAGAGGAGGVEPEGGRLWKSMMAFGEQEEVGDVVWGGSAWDD
mmetsp:Transcript_1937/g.4426  ORF Transcript_1937/g.4426 Transcript_1937/m.4426 type:complete len:130 (+) Transcript_1937:762-1151(+)